MFYTNCQLKSTIICQDEWEKDQRQLLNFGHTLGHALEKASHFKLCHGEAVILGIIAANRIAKIKQILSSDSYNTILNSLKSLSIIPSISTPDSDFSESVKHYLMYDKKTTNGNINFVLLSDIGLPYQHNNHYGHPIDTVLISETIDWLLTEFSGK